MDRMFSRPIASGSITLTGFHSLSSSRLAARPPRCYLRIPPARNPPRNIRAPIGGLETIGDSDGPGQDRSAACPNQHVDIVDDRRARSRWVDAQTGVILPIPVPDVPADFVAPIKMYGSPLGVKQIGRSRLQGIYSALSRPEC